MLFNKTYKKVLSGAKTQTRRVEEIEHFRAEDNGKIVAVYGRGGRLKWKVGSVYAVQPQRGRKAVGHIKITSINMQSIQEISLGDAQKEGVASLEEFRELWNTIHDKHPLNNLSGYSWRNNPNVWVLEFELVEES